MRRVSTNLNNSDYGKLIAIANYLDISSATLLHNLIKQCIAGAPKEALLLSQRGKKDDTSNN